MRLALEIIGAHLIALIVMMLIATASWAQGTVTCYTTESAYEKLSETFGESRAITLTYPPSGVNAEVWINTETETWTIITTDARGKSCLQMSGQGYILGDGSETPEVEPDPT